LGIIGLRLPESGNGMIELTKALRIVPDLNPGVSPWARYAIAD
jgi:hypothetical protein